MYEWRTRKSLLKALIRMTYKSKKYCKKRMARYSRSTIIVSPHLFCVVPIVLRDSTITTFRNFQKRIRGVSNSASDCKRRRKILDNILG